MMHLALSKKTFFIFRPHFDLAIFVGIFLLMGVTTRVDAAINNFFVEVNAENIFERGLVDNDVCLF